jgi:hypothetical protein
MKAKQVKIHEGGLIAQAGVKYDFTEITGWLDCSKADSKTVFSELTTVGGDAYFRGWTGSAPKLTTVGGDAWFQGWTGSAPRLITVGGYADFQGWTGSAPKLTTVGGDAWFQGWAGSAPKLATVGGGAWFRGWTGSAPKLTTVGVDADFRGWTNNTGNVKTNVSAEELRAAFLADGFLYADGILAEIVQQRGNVYRVRIVGKSVIGYVVTNGNGAHSHGATLKEARDGLIFKLTDRDTTRFKAWTLETKVTLADAVQAYRAITGACEQGVRLFIEKRGGVAKSLAVREIVEMTRGEYGAEVFRKFFDGEKK